MKSYKFHFISLGMAFQISHYVAVGVKRRKEGGLYFANNAIAQTAPDMGMAQLCVDLNIRLNRLSTKSLEFSEALKM